MKYSSFLYLSCLLVAIDRPWQTDAKGFFGKLVELVTGGNGDDYTDDNNNNNNTNNINININNRRNKEGTNSNSNSNSDYDYPTIRLSNGVHFPLVGLGVGNMQPEVVPAIISHGLHENKNIRLIDTAHVSKNEFLVAKGIVEGVDRLLSVGVVGSDAAATARNSNNNNNNNNNNEKIEVHVITKVWYTHLGYQRTLLSAKSSLESLKEAIDHPNVDLKVHLLLHWPRCYDEIPWMECEAEEASLPEETKLAGPPPHLDPKHAWKESWRALEELVADGTNPIAGIGVSNFHRRDLEELSRVATILPHLVETSTWSLLYDPLVIEFCHKQKIHLVAHNLMEGVLYQSDTAPFASHHLLSIANDLTNTLREKKTRTTNNNNGDAASASVVSKQQQQQQQQHELSAAQVVLAWLVQHSISVIPRTTDLAHLQENSAAALSRIPAMDDGQVKVVAQSVEALISGDDLTEDAFVTLTFHAKSKDVSLYWHDPEYGGEIEVAKIEKGRSFEESSHPGHEFKIYDANGGSMELFRVAGKYGEHKHIEL